MNYYADNLVAGNYKYRPPYHPKFIDGLVREVELKKTDIPLDLLCGQGEIASLLAAHCDAVVGADGSRQMLDLAEKKQGVKYLLGDVNSPEFIDVFEGKKFSHCFVGRAIHWIEAGALAELNKRLFDQYAWLVTMQSGFAKNNAWLGAYKEVLRNFGGNFPAVDWISREKILGAGFNYLKPVSANFVMKLNVDSLYRTALSYNSSSHLLQTREEEIKSSLRGVLGAFLQEDGFLAANISNSAFVYRS